MDGRLEVSGSTETAVYSRRAAAVVGHNATSLEAKLLPIRNATTNFSFSQQTLPPLEPETEAIQGIA